MKKVAFIWQGLDGRYGDKWFDGLHGAMKLIEKVHEVHYIDAIGAEEKLNAIKPDVILFWEAPCSILGKDSVHYKHIMQRQERKALLFAGGMIRPEWVRGFDMLFVESRVNEEDCERYGIPYARAFGVDTDIFKTPKKPTPKEYKAVFHATFADWKRHDLFAQAFGSDGAVCGRKQEFDLNGYNECVARGVHIFPELYGKELVDFLLKGEVLVNTSNEQGGGQRCTLEAMALGLPVVVMSNSPKNCEYVLESSAGVIVDPSPEAIRKGVEDIKSWTKEEKERGVAYVKGKWTHRHYADNLLKWI